MIKLIHGECLEDMAKLPSASVDMIYCDLPYGTTQCKWDSVIPIAELWAQYKRLLMPYGCVVLHAADPFSSYLVCSNPDWWKQTLVWEKNCASNFLNAKRQHLVTHENVLVFAPGKTLYNPQMTKGEPYTNKRTGRDDTGDCYGNIRQRTDTVNNGQRYPTSVLKFKRETGLHPTQKPVALAEYLIRTYTNDGDTVLDNCMGSGTAGVACVNTGRQFIGIEQNEEYFKVAQSRICRI